MLANNIISSKQSVLFLERDAGIKDSFGVAKAG